MDPPRYSDENGSGSVSVEEVPGKNVRKNPEIKRRNGQNPFPLLFLIALIG
jgi:hypothetical protein